MSIKLAKTMRYLEVSINQGKPNDWNELPEEEKQEWIEVADAIESLPG